MKYFKRKIDKFLAAWKDNPERMPLIVRGCRQIGKTESILNFAQSNYAHVVAINFVEEPKYKNIVADGYKPEDIIRNISRLNPDFRFLPGKTILFFDEMQEFPEIATSLKFFKTDGRYDVICSGSMLGLNYKRIESNSVGYKTDFLMHSFDFEEFLWAKGYGEDIAEDMFKHIVEQKAFSKLEFDLYNGLFLDYCILGGMPAVIKEYITKKSFQGTLNLQRQLVLDYREDVRKYASGVDQTRILNVFNRIPIQLAQENKKFQISKVASNAKTKDYIGCIEWLADSGTINICRCLNFPELPLKGNYDDNKYKLYFADNGLLVAMLDDESQEDLRANKNLGTYKGALYENVVAEALAKSGAELYYYKREDSSLEEDFFLRTRENLVPIEVKATNGRAKSLRTLIDSDKYSDIKWGIKLVNGNIGFANNILTLPYFCAFLLKRYCNTI